MEQLTDITFYTIEKAIRTYRTYAQKKLKEHGFKITIDQWLIIRSLLENPGMSQQEIAEQVFKDTASVTRMITLLVKSGYVSREVHDSDRRKSNLTVTPEGVSVIRKVHSLVLKNRATALHGIAPAHLEIVNSVMKTIIANCK